MRPVQIFGAAVAVLATAGAVQPALGQYGGYPAPAITFEHNTDHPGGDYHEFDLSSGRPEECRDDCLADAQCAAFTYGRPGAHGPYAHCWLKNAVTPPVPNGCCDSGVKVAAPGGPPGPPPGPVGGSRFEWNTDLPGADYTEFDLPAPRPHLCERACEQDGRCRAFTYGKPGVKGPAGHCWLKAAVPPPQPNGCCVSGVVR